MDEDTPQPAEQTEDSQAAETPEGAPGQVARLLLGAQAVLAVCAIIGVAVAAALGAWTGPEGSGEISWGTPIGLTVVFSVITVAALYARQELQR